MNKSFKGNLKVDNDIELALYYEWNNEKMTKIRELFTPYIGKCIKITLQVHHVQT